MTNGKLSMLVFIVLLKAPNLAFNLPNAHSMMSFHCKVSFQCIALAYSFHHLHTTSLGMVTEDKLGRQVQKLQLVLHYKNSSLARRNDVTSTCCTE